MPSQVSTLSKLMFWSLFLALTARTWAFDLHIPVPIADDGTDKPGGRFSFGNPFHIIWTLDGESGKLTFVAEPEDGPNITLAKDVNMSELEAFVRLTPAPPIPEFDTYYLHAINSSNPKQVIATTSNFWIFDDKAQTATLVVFPDPQTTVASTRKVSSTQLTSTSSNNPASSVTSSASSTTSTSISTTRSTNSSTVLPSSTIPTSSNVTTSITSVVSIPPTGTSLSATPNRSTPQNAIIGGVIGGVAFLLLLMIALLLCYRRHKNRHLTGIPVVIVPSNYSPPPSKLGASYTNSPITPQWPPAGMVEVPREWRKPRSGLESISPVPATPQVQTPNSGNDAESEEDARRLRFQAEVMNERIAELESQLVRGLDMGRQPPGYVSQRQSVVPRPE